MAPLCLLENWIPVSSDKYSEKDGPKFICRFENPVIYEVDAKKSSRTTVFENLIWITRSIFIAFHIFSQGLCMLSGRDTNQYINQHIDNANINIDFCHGP